MTNIKYELITHDTPEPNVQPLIEEALNYINAEHPTGKCVGVVLKLVDGDSSAVHLHCMWELEIRKSKKVRKGVKNA